MAYQIRRPESEEDRQLPGGGDFLSLTEEDPKFTGNALFQGDPADNELGYFEYYEHWHPVLKSVPCAGEDCPLCEDGDRPRLRAKTLWLVTHQGGKTLDTPKVMIYTINSNLIKQFTELRHEGDKIKGRGFRVSRLDDRGNYSIMPKATTITATEVKAALKEADIDLGEMTLNQLKGKMEKLHVGDVMKDDDDEPRRSSSKPKATAKGAASKGKAKPVDDDDDDDDDDETPDNDTPETGPVPDIGEDEKVTVVKVIKKDNQIVVESEAWDDTPTLWGNEELDVTEFAKGTQLIVNFQIDDEGDYVLSTAEEAPADDDDDDEDEKPAPKATGKKKPAAKDDDEGELPDSIDEMTMVVTSVQADESTINVENDEEGLSFTLYFLTETEIDFDDYEEGDKIIVSAVKDNVGDMVSQDAPEKVKAAAKRGRK